MARYDAETEKFMQDVSSGEKKPLDAERGIRTAMGAMKSIAGGPRTAGQKLTGTLVKAILEKTGGISVLRIYEILNDTYQRLWWDWEPETIWFTLERDHGVQPTQELKDIVMALQMVVNTNFAHEQWNVFEKVGHAFNENVVDFSTVQPLELDEIALTIYLLNRVRPKTEFEPEVYGYIASCAKHSGVVYLPENLFGGAQEFLDRMDNDLEMKKKTIEKHPDAHIQMERLKEVEEYVQNGIQAERRAA